MNYWTMKQIGTLFGTTSHQIGKKLKMVGLRTPDGKPSLEAFQSHLCEQLWDCDHVHYLWGWERDRTVAILEQSGLERVETQPVSG
jgi:hypothetical protein